MVVTKKSLVINAFRPGSEIEDPDLFSGRKKAVLDLTESLMSEGSCPMILGDRGLGKSSLAKQVGIIAKGGRSLLKRYNAREDIIPLNESYVVLYMGCSDHIRTKTDLLRRLTDGVTDTVMRQIDGQYQLTEKSTNTAISFKVFERESAKKWQPSTWSPRRTDNETDYEQALVDATTRLSEVTGSRVLLIVDELDRMLSTKGLASFIKVATSDTLKFMLVGIAQNVGDLLADHKSLERVIMPSRIEPMTDPELIAIIDRAMTRLKAEGVDIAFHPDTSVALADVAMGFPWFVHVLGREALLSAHRDNAREVSREHLVHSIVTLTTNRFAQQFSDQYQHVVGDSVNREIALRSFALWRDRDIPTSEVYPLMKRLGISNPSEYRRQLCHESRGSVLTPAPYREKGMVRFSNEMFKVYVRIRSSIFSGVRDRVNNEWNRPIDS